MRDSLYLTELINQIQITMREQKEYLIELDSKVGDSDLGLTMSDGFAAAYEAACSDMETDCGKLLYKAGKKMGNTVPSTMGTLMAAGFMRAGKNLKGKRKLTDMDIADLFSFYEEGVMDLGKAKPGDKTFLDGFHPAVQALKLAVEGGISLEEAATQAYKSAQEGFRSTTTMVAKHGRAATRGEKSRALEDPGAAVAVFIMEGFMKSVRSF